MKKSKIIEVKYDPTNIHKDYILQPSARFIPEWFKDIPRKGFVSFIDDNDREHSVRTVKTCPGIVKILSKGYIVPCPFDIIISVKGSDYVVTPPEAYTNYIDIHHPAQLNFATGTEFLIIKVLTPYTVHMDSEVDFAYLNPVVHNFSALHSHQIPNGILDFKNQCSLNSFLMVPMGADRTYTIKAGTPLSQIIPLEKIKLDLKYTETVLWKSPPTNTIQGVSTWFDKIKYRRSMNND